jgi:hypothetical protein
LTKPNLSGLYWISLLTRRSGKFVTRRRSFWHNPIRGKLARDAARLAAEYTGETVALWLDGSGEIVWTERPQYAKRATGRTLDTFTYTPE